MLIDGIGEKIEETDCLKFRAAGFFMERKGRAVGSETKIVMDDEI